MFKKKSVKPKTEIVFFDETGTQLFKEDFFFIPIKEEVLLAKCLEFFNDPAPCFIHRSAMTMRLLYEIEDYFKIQPKNVFTAMEEFCNVLEYIDLPGIRGFYIDSEVAHNIRF